MQSRWRADEAAATIARWAQQGVAEDVSLAVYGTRLLGSEPSLVLHGGGNSSVKSVAHDLAGDPVEVLCVKGSGWDMGAIEPPGLPAVRLEPLRRLQRLQRLSDEDMVNALRINLLDAAAPNPSVETLLHAFLPHKFVDHTHANAVLALTDQPDGEAICRDTFGDRVAYVPYIMPGFALAQACAAASRAAPEADALILLKHGIFTMGETAEAAYERMIALVSCAEARVAKAARQVFVPAAPAGPTMHAAEAAPVLRGLLALETDREEGLWRRFVLAHRTGPTIRAFVDGADLARYALLGPVTPDHAIRTKPLPLIAPAPLAGDPAGFRAGLEAAIARYKADYMAYVTRHNTDPVAPKTPLDPAPRIVLVPGLGIFAAGENAKAAAIAADLYEANIEVIANAEAIGRYTTIDEAEQFDIEYWSLEQAKLGKGAEKPLARQIAIVTGGGGTIGAAIGKAFRAAGAEVALLDRDGDAAAKAAKPIGVLAVACDVTDTASVAAATAKVVEAFGGIDILVSNAGAAWQGRIGEVDDATLRASFELNFFAHQTVAKAAVAVMRAQGTGGVLLFNASKQAVNPGPNFGPYGLPKAAAMGLARQYAIDYGAEGIRSNAVNADRIRSGLLTDAMVASRSKARGVSEHDYMAGNLLGREVTAADVAEAFLALALARKTTGAVLTVDGGNIAAALR